MIGLIALMAEWVEPALDVPPAAVPREQAQTVHFANE